MELDGRPAGADELAALALSNYGHFTTMRVEHGHVLGLSMHLRRLADDCSALFGMALDVSRVRGLVRHACVEPVAVARVTVFAPDLDLRQPGRAVEPRVLVTTRSAPAELAFPPLRVKTVQYGREAAQHKHVGLFGTVLTRRHAQLDGFDDALFVDNNLRVSEGATWNVGFIDGERILWPENAVLDGITMRLVKALPGFESVDAEIDLTTAGRMRAAFVTNAAVGVRPIAAIDEMTYPTDDPALTALSDAYRAIPGEPL